jgi:hypothetical protein
MNLIMLAVGLLVKSAEKVYIDRALQHVKGPCREIFGIWFFIKTPPRPLSCFLAGFNLALNSLGYDGVTRLSSQRLSELFKTALVHI